jgi:hypothetical protein
MKRASAIFTSLILLSLSIAAAPDDKKEMTAAEIVAKHIEAVGGN